MKLRALSLNENDEGFSLVEVMVASAILIVLALAVSSLMVNLGKGQNTAKEKADWYEFQQRLTQDLIGKHL